MALPKRIWVKEEQDNHGNKYLDAGRRAEDIATDEVALVGVYVLKEACHVQKVVKVEKE